MKHLKRFYFYHLLHCVISVRIRNYSGPYFSAFVLNTERYGVSLPIQSEYWKMQTRITPNTDTFHAVLVFNFSIISVDFRIMQTKFQKDDHSSIHMKKVSCLYTNLKSVLPFKIFQQTIQKLSVQRILLLIFLEKFACMYAFVRVCG